MKNVILTIIAVLFSLTISVAANADVTIDIDTVIVATGGNANAASNENQWQCQGCPEQVESVPKQGTPIAIAIKENLQEIEELQDELLKCNKYSFRNMELGHKLVTKFYMAFNLDNDKAFLKAATVYASLVEKNYTNGKDIKQNMPMAQYSMTDTYLYWRDAIKELQGPEAAQKFYEAKNLKKLLQ